MKRNPDYMIKQAADMILIVPVGKAAAEFPGMISINETGRMLWELLEEEHSIEELVELLCTRYDVEPWKAHADLEVFLRRLRLAGALIEDKNA